MPPADYFKDPYHIPDAQATDAKLRLDFLIWYWSHFLPAAAGVEFFPKDLVNYRLPMQPLKLVPGFEKTTLKGPMVTVPCEAFGLVLVKNCWPKWTHIVPQKARDDKWPIPKCNEDDESTHKYHKTLWSLSRNGQKKSQGWAPEGYTALNDSMDFLTKFREAQKKDKYTQVKGVLALVRKSNKIPAGEKNPPVKGKGKKRKADTPAPVYAKITVEEEDCEWDDALDVTAV